jgi:hypothetical protein
MRRFAGLATAGLLVLSACSDRSAPPLDPSFDASGSGASAAVTSSADDGPGSLRAAIAAANADPSVRVIQLATGLAPIELQSSLVYSGWQPLTVHGSGVVLDGAALAPGASAFLADGGADLSFSSLTVRHAPGNGIEVQVPAGAHGTLVLTFASVTVSDNGFFGVLINDQTNPLADREVDPLEDFEAGSDAGLVVRVTNSVIRGNGLAALDNDGFRINEGGLGGIDATVLGTVFAGNGADGLELDERAAGDARFTIQQSTLSENGAYDVVTDPDDGIDVDEAGDGDIDGHFVHVEASDNSEQGVDLNENDAGDLRVVMTQVEGSGNGEEGIEFEEDDDFAGGGDIYAELRGVTTDGNGRADDGDAGLKLREKGTGLLVARVVQAWATGNLNDLGGILFREDATGDMDVEVVQSTASANDDYGIRFQGSGAARLLKVTASDNGGQQIRNDAAVSVTRIPGI